MCQRFDKEGKITITLVELKNFGIPKFFVAKFCMGLNLSRQNDRYINIPPHMVFVTSLVNK